MDARGRLRRFAALRGLSAGQLAALAAGFVDRSIAGGTVLIRQGARGKAVYLVIEGEVSVTLEDDGIERELARLGPGALLGQMALLDGAPAAATCRAVGPTRVGELGRAAFGLLTGARAEMAYAFQRAIAEQVARDFREHMARAGGVGGVDSERWGRLAIPG